GRSSRRPTAVRNSSRTQSPRSRDEAVTRPFGPRLGVRRDGFRGSEQRHVARGHRRYRRYLDSETGLALRRLYDFDGLLAEPPGSLDRRAEIQAFVLRLLDQHHGLEGIHVVDALLLALRRDLSLVRPVVELHLRDAGDLANLTEIELHLVQMLGQVDRL